MARTEAAADRATLVAKQGRDNLAAASVIASHSLQHICTNGFYIILPAIYATLGLTPVTAGAMEAVRRISSGAATMGGGLLVDQLQHRRILILYLSLTTMGFGYLLVGLAPTYLLILLAMGLAGAAGSIWHPAAMSLLSQRYPERRGLLISLHRSSGNVGDTVGPIGVGALLGILAWQGILYSAFPIAIVLVLLLWLILRRVPGWQATQAQSSVQRPIREQLSALKKLFKGKGLVVLLLVAGVSGLDQGGLLLWLPLYLQETQGMDSIGQGIHVSLLTGVGIATGPLIGALSDRIGRRSVIVLVLASKTGVAVLMALVGSGLGLTLLVAIMGAFMFGVNALVQVAALDLAEGQRLEGSLIGLLWGNNALFVGAAPVLVGLLVASLGYPVLFWYIAAMNALAFLVSLMLPAMRGRATG